MNAMRRLVLLALVAAVGSAVAQTPEIFLRPMSKAEEAAAFHPVRPGMRAELRLRAYGDRLRMEAASPFGNLLWQQVGPTSQGGRVVDIESPAGRPDQMLVAFASGGLHRTSDDGITWESLFDTESAYSIGDFAVSRDGQTIWIGTGERNSQRTSYSGTGVFKSTDGGKSWQNMGLAETHRIGRIQINPRDENIVYVGALGSLYTQNPARGVYKTTDGGKTWSHVLKIDEFTGVIDLRMDPKNPDTLYAAAWDRDRKAWNFRESGPGSALYKTTDGGRTWKVLGKGVLPQGADMGRMGITISPTNPKRLYVLVDNQGADLSMPWYDEGQPAGVLTASRFRMLTRDVFIQLDAATLQPFLNGFGSPRLDAAKVLADVKSGALDFEKFRADLAERNPGRFTYDIVNSQVFRSDDGGETWTKTHPWTLGEMLGYYCGRVEINPHNPDEIYVMGTYLIRSRDGGKTFERTGRGTHVDYHSVWFDPNRPGRLAIGNDGGFYTSGDNGDTYRHINNLAVGQFTTIAVDNKTPYNIYGGLQDNGTMKGPSSAVGGRGSANWTSIGGGDGSAIAVDPRNDGDVVYIASQFGSHSAINQATGQRWQTRANARQGEPPLRYNWISPLILSPHHPDIVYLGAQRVYRSLNQGRTWEAISPDITKNLPNGDVPFSTLKDLSESPLKFGLIYAGADDGSVKVTKNHGFTWEDIATPAPDKWVSRVVASRWDEGTVYVAQSGYRDDEWTPYLWKSTDYGRNWTSIVGNLPLETINVVREDPKKKGMLYVGTDLGVWVTYNDGALWEPLHGGIPRTPVHDIAIQEREMEMVIASHARSVFKFDLKPLHLVDEALRATPIKLLSAPDMQRGRWGFERRQPWDTSLPPSPQLTGQFWVAKAGATAIRIKDAAGKVWVSGTVDAKPGFNTFALDLELKRGKWVGEVPTILPKTVQEALADLYAERRGEYLAAGEYTLEAEQGTQSWSQTWRLRG